MVGSSTAVRITTAGTFIAVVCCSIAVIEGVGSSGCPGLHICCFDLMVATDCTFGTSFGHCLLFARGLGQARCC